MLSREDIVKHIFEIAAGYEANPHMGAYYLGRFLGLYDSIRLSELLPDKPITFADVDRMAIETITMSGKITIREDTPPDPSVGWPGSDTVEGEITGRFEVPAGSIMIAAIDPMFTLEGPGEPDTLLYWINEGPLKAKIGKYDGIINQVDKQITTDIELTGVTKKGDRAVVEFKVVLK
jgi:hypothetical protein